MTGRFVFHGEVTFIELASGMCLLIRPGIGGLAMGSRPEPTKPGPEGVTA